MSLMQLVEAYTWLLRGTGEMLVYLWPVSAIVLVVGACGLLLPMFGGKFNRGPALTGLAASYLCPLLILLVGAALPYDGPPHPHWKEPPNWRMYVLYAPLVFHIALACGLLLFQKGRRVRAALVLIPGLWLSLCALFPAGINIVGVGP